VSDELRVAVVTDVHGNLAALQAVLAAIDRRGPYDRLIGGGDFCLNGPDPRAALDLMVERAHALLKGNTDRDIVNHGADDPDLGAKKRTSIEWTRDQLGDEGIATLDSLRFSHRVDAPDGSSLLAVHANPHDIDRHIFPDAPAADVRVIIGDIDHRVRILVFGHLHIPYRRQIGKLRLFDVAACGLPRDGDRRAVWGEFTWSQGGGWRGRIHRVEYDYGATVLRMLDSGMPNPERRIRDLVRATYE
jgi:predicted phosphodiesterase